MAQGGRPGNGLREANGRPGSAGAATPASAAGAMLGLGGGGGGGGGGNGGGNGLGVGASSAESSPAPSEVPRRRGRPQALEPLLCGGSEEGSDTPCAATPTAPGSAVSPRPGRP
jgi:hypothetical protein